MLGITLSSTAASTLHNLESIAPPLHTTTPRPRPKPQVPCSSPMHSALARRAAHGPPPQGRTHGFGGARHVVQPAAVHPGGRRLGQHGVSSPLGPAHVLVRPLYSSHTCTCGSWLPREVRATPTLNLGFSTPNCVTICQVASLPVGGHLAHGERGTGGSVGYQGSARGYDGQGALNCRP